MPKSSLFLSFFLLCAAVSIAQDVPRSSHVWMIAEENHSVEEVVGNSRMPYYNRLIQEYGLEERVRLLGHVPPERQDSLYRGVDVVVLTSRSEGIPLVLMEAMARGKIVVAPAITGIPELVVAGQTGFLYEPGSVEDFVTRILWLGAPMPVGRAAGDSPGVAGASKPDGVRLDGVRRQAREQVRLHFNRRKNLELFGDVFLERIFLKQMFPEQICPEQLLPVRQHSGANRRTA